MTKAEHFKAKYKDIDELHDKASRFAIDSITNLSGKVITLYFDDKSSLAIDREYNEIIVGNKNDKN